MNLLVCLLAVAMVGFAAADTKTYPRGCIYILGRCDRECEEGTHSYTTGCGYLTPEPTCEVPEPQEDNRGKICDFSACYCDAPTVRHPETKKCVLLEDCPERKVNGATSLATSSAGETN